VVLELGGKSPTVIDKNVDLEVVGRRIVYGNPNPDPREND
jgi:acyl-CoA reductase-like NAD-dependent aldehyde dehydrogenase